MKRTEKLTSTSNEFLARKKNVSEEVKLREALASLECKKSLTKDALRQDVARVKTELRQIRRSTGHSIEALPPTPFRLMARRYSVMPETTISQDYLSSCVSPEFRYMLDELYDVMEEDIDNFDGAPNLPMINNTEKDRRKNSILSGDTVRVVTFFEPQDENHKAMKISERNYQEIKESHSRSHEVSPENTLHLPILTQHGNASIVTKQHNKDFLRVPDQDLNSSTSSDLALPQLVKHEREMSDSSLSPQVTFRQSAEQSPASFHFEFNPDDTRASDFGSPVSKKLMSILSEGEWKRQEYVRKNSIVGFDSLAAQLVARRTMDDFFKKDPSDKSKKENHVSTKGKQEGWRAYRDARTRCRTCMERFRQNAAFQRQKLEQEILMARQIELPLDRKKSIGNASMQRGPLSPNSDLEQYFSDEVLDFDDEKSVANPNVNRKKSKRKGYSRKRLNELAEPRKGTKRKTLFSKRLITKVM